MVSEAAFFALSYTDVCERAKTRLICAERIKEKDAPRPFFITEYAFFRRK